MKNHLQAQISIHPVALTNHLSMLVLPMALVWLMLTHTHSNIKDSKTSLVLEIALLDQSPELSLLQLDKTQSLSTTYCNSWQVKNSMLSMMASLPCLSTWARMRKLHLNTSGIMSQLLATTRSLTTVSLQECTSETPSRQVLRKVLSTLLTSKIMAHHTDTTEHAMIHWSATNT